MNPGGPGGSGVDLVEGVGGGLPDELRARFDIVGFDPRGVGRSRPLACWTRREYDSAFRATRVLRRPSLIAALRRARSFTRACERRSRALLPYIGTAYVVRDMDLLRAAVGDEKLTYFGYSFGTAFRTVYANLFPQRVRALTLDGSYDPVAYARDPYKYDRGQYVALEASRSRFLAWCSKHAKLCGFGKGRAAAAFDRLIARLEAHPRRVRTPEGAGTLGSAAALTRSPSRWTRGRSCGRRWAGRSPARRAAPRAASRPSPTPTPPNTPPTPRSSAPIAPSRAAG